MPIVLLSHADVSRNWSGCPEPHPQLIGQFVGPVSGQWPLLILEKCYLCCGGSCCLIVCLMIGKNKARDSVSVALTVSSVFGTVS